MSAILTSPLLDRMMVVWAWHVLRVTVQQINCRVILDDGIMDLDDLAEHCQTTPRHVQLVLDLLVERGRLSLTPEGRYEALCELLLGSDQ